MSLDKSELEGRLFEGLADTQNQRYIFACNLKTGVTRVSSNAVEYFGLSGEYLENIHSVFENHIHPDDREKINKEFDSVFQNEKKRMDMCIKLKNKEGEYVSCTFHGISVKGVAEHADLFMGNIENHGILNNIDGLTGLYNVYEFTNYYERLSTTSDLLSVMFLGVGRFSDINETYGFSFGDKLIREVATILLQMIRPNGYIFKMDGMHFAFLFENKTKEQIEGFYYQVKQMLKNDIIVSGISVSLVCCAGVILDCKDYDVFSIRSSGRYALGRSKRDKDGKIIYFDDTLLGDNQRNLNLMRELQKSVQNGCKGFFLNYQPIINAKDETIQGSEALLRFESETMGVVPPSVFIPWLEKDPCFYELGNWIIETAIEEMKPMIAVNPDFLLNINIAYPQVSNSDFKFQVVKILMDKKYPSDNLCLELTERCRQLDKAFLTNEINFLRSKGIKIALDDFGGGASMSTLQEFPVDTIKISRGFTTDILSNKINQTIVNAITICAADLDIKVCVEGLEERDMIEFIKKYPVYSFQGFYFSKPMGAKEFMEKFRK